LPSFVVHRHQARHLHFDFRLEMDGVLKSWAVPKGPPDAPGVRRLAIAVEDHPLDYGAFEGVIPEGMYGAGTVEIWDKGQYEMLEEKPGHLLFCLEGSKLKGEYVLLHTGEKQWLFFQRKAQLPSI